MPQHLGENEIYNPSNLNHARFFYFGSYSCVQKFFGKLTNKQLKTYPILLQMSGHRLNLYYKNLHRNRKVDFLTLSCRLQGEIWGRDMLLQWCHMGDWRLSCPSQTITAPATCCCSSATRSDMALMLPVWFFLLWFFSHFLFVWVSWYIFYACLISFIFNSERFVLFSYSGDCSSLWSPGTHIPSLACLVFA